MAYSKFEWEMGETGRRRGSRNDCREEEETLLQLEQTNAQKAAESRDPEMEGHGTRRTAVAGRTEPFFGARAVKTEEEI